MSEVFEVKYGLPQKVEFCKRCVMLNQRPSSPIEFKYRKDHRLEKR